MLGSTLVVFTSEFGRTPWSENTKGTEHNGLGFTSWLAGGGVKGGVIEEATWTSSSTAFFHLVEEGGGPITRIRV